MSLPATTTFHDAVENELRMISFLLQGGNEARAAKVALRLAQIYGRSERSSDAISILWWACELHPAAFDITQFNLLLRAIGPGILMVFREAARRNVEAGHDLTAARVLRALTTHMPTCATTRLWLAETLRGAGDADAAIAELWAAAEAFRSAHRYDGHIQMLQRILEIDANDGVALQELTRAQLQQCRNGAAVRTATRWLRVQPGNRRARAMLAQALACHDRTSSALGVLRTVVDELTAKGLDARARTLVADALTWCPADESFCVAVEALLPGAAAATPDTSAPQSGPSPSGTPLRVIAS